MKELTKTQLEETYNQNSKSARHNTRIGKILVTDQFVLECIDLAIFPINECPRCHSKNTYHKRMQKNKINENTWADKRIKGQDWLNYLKFDYCLACGHTFVIEMYTYKIIKEIGKPDIIKKTKKKNIKKERNDYIQ